MKILEMVVGLMLTPVLVAQGDGQVGTEPAKAPEKDPGHFRWSVRTAHELDRRPNLRTAKELTAEQRQQLFAYVLKVIQTGNDLGTSEKELEEDAWETRVKLVDLNDDGKLEVIAQATGFGPCGGTGNCLVWVFAMTSEGPKVLLDSALWGAFELIKVRPWSTNGYKDIVLAGSQDSSGQDLYSFKFSNGAYRPAACFRTNWLDTSGEYLEARNSPEITPIPCMGVVEKAK